MHVKFYAREYRRFTRYIQICKVGSLLKGLRCMVADGVIFLSSLLKPLIARDTKLTLTIEGPALFESWHLGSEGSLLGLGSLSFD